MKLNFISNNKYKIINPYMYIELFNTNHNKISILELKKYGDIVQLNNKIMLIFHEFSPSSYQNKQIKQQLYIRKYCSVALNSETYKM